MKQALALRRSIRRAVSSAVLAVPSSVLVLLGLEVQAAPVTVVAPQKASDNLVDPNAESAAAPAPEKAGSAAAAVDLTLADKGVGLYKSYCQKCHGLDMVTPGGGFFDLRTFPLDDKPRFVNSVTNGKRAMPAWNGVLKPTDIDALWSYVASGQLSKKPAP